jgi:hypothetical protein
MSVWIYDGTVALTNGSKTVTGTGTTWGGGNVMEGDQFNTPAGPYEVESVASGTSLQFVRPYAGPSVSGQTYAIVPTQGRIVPVAKLLSTYLTTLGTLKDAWEAGNLLEVGDLVGKLDAATLALASGASKTGFKQLPAAAKTRTVEDKGREWVSFFDYMTPAEIADAQSRLPVLDHTASMQTAINNHKGGKIVWPASAVCQAVGLVMNGAEYNGTELDFQGEFLLKPRPTTTSATNQGAWVGILFKDVEGCTLNFRGNGNRANQPNEEHVYLVGFAGVRRMNIPKFIGREVKGDGAYIGQKEWTSQSLNSDGITFGLFEITNSASDGRNGMSIISCDNLAITTFRSINVGGIVGGYTQPGGLDIEPDKNYESCKNITIGSLLVVTAGTSGLAIAGRAGFDVTNNVVIGAATVVNTCLPTAVDGNGAMTQTNNHTLIVTSATDVKIKSYQGKFTAAYGDGVIIGDVKGVTIEGSVKHVREGARIGGDVLDASGGGAGVIGSDIKLDVSEVTRFGIRTGKLSGRTKIRGQVSEPVAGFYPGGLMGVVGMSYPGYTYTQKDVEYSVSVDASALWARSYRNDGSYPVAFDNTVIRDCTLSGTSWSNIVSQVGDMKVRRINVVGVTNMTATPPSRSDLWVAGQLFTSDVATAAGAPTGWTYTGTEIRATGVVA